jgi:hypothetical protein
VNNSNVRSTQTFSIVYIKMTDAYTKCIGSMGSDITDRQLMECASITGENQTRQVIQSVALVFAGFIVFVMQVCLLSMCELKRRNVTSGMRDKDTLFGMSTSNVVVLTHSPIITFFTSYVHTVIIGWVCHAVCWMCSEEKYKEYVVEKFIGR